MAKQISTNVTWHDGEISREHRFEILRQKGVTVWFTGLSGSGKSTVAVALEKALFAMGKLSYRLDGDNVRLGINKNLGFSEEDRLAAPLYASPEMRLPNYSGMRARSLCPVLSVHIKPTEIRYARYMKRKISSLLKYLSTVR